MRPAALLMLLDGGVPSWVKAGAALDYDFAGGHYYQTGKSRSAALISLITTSRASTATDLLPTSPAGAAFNTFASNVPRLTPGLGLLVFQSVTNSLLNSGVPATQTTASLANGTYTLWVNGAGSATSSAGSATGSGFGAATQGGPNTIAITSPGTVVVTVAGALNQFQLDNTSFGGPYVPTAGTTATCLADVVTVKTPPVFGSALTLFASGLPLAPNGFAATQSILTASDGTSNNRLVLFRNATNALSVAASITGGANTTLTSAVWNQGTAGKLVASTAAAAAAMSFNGATPVTGSPTAAPVGVNTIQIGLNGTSVGPFEGYISRIAIWPTIAQPAAFLQAVTR